MARVAHLPAEAPVPLLKATGHHANAVAPLEVHGSVLGALAAAFDAPRAAAEAANQAKGDVRVICTERDAHVAIYGGRRGRRGGALPAEPVPGVSSTFTLSLPRA